MFTIYHKKRRTRTYTVDLFEIDGTTEVILAAEDVVRFKVNRGEDAILIDANSYETESGGTRVAFTVGTNDVCITVGQGDVNSDDFPPGCYDCEVMVVDNSEHLTVDGREENSYKHVEDGVFVLQPAAGGELEDEQSSSSGESSGGSEESSSSSSGV